MPTLALISSSLLASSVIQQPRYLKRDTCSKGTLFNVISRCIPFGFAVPFIIITFVFFTLISIPYALHIYIYIYIYIKDRYYLLSRKILEQEWEWLKQPFGRIKN